MSRPKPPKPGARNDVAVKIDKAIVGKAKMVATHRGTSVAELLSDLLRPAVDKAFATMVRDLDAGEKADK